MNSIMVVGRLFRLYAVRYAAILSVLMGMHAMAQQGSGPRIGSSILNDSSRMQYGPSTTQQIFENDILWGREQRYRPIDTTIRDYHHWTYLQRLQNLYKDLGNVGTALHPVFPTLPSTIGVSTGFDAYTPYYATQKPTYFNTRSPYTRVMIVWAGNGRSLSLVRFSRNINPRWNFGFSFRPILVDKQIQRQRKGDRQTVSYYYDAHMSYSTKNDRYKVFFNFRRFRHLVIENGGVIVTSQGIRPDAAMFSTAVQPSLTTASSEEIRHSGHLFQQYALIPNRLDIYNQTDIDEKINIYKDTNIGGAPAGFYDDTSPLGRRDNSIEDKTYFLYLTNKTGVRGWVGNFFHDAYFKVRPYRFSYEYLTNDMLDIPLDSVEYYFGGHASYHYDSLFRISGWADLLLENNYNMGMDLTSKWLDAKVHHLVSKPSFLSDAYRGTFDVWNNNFRNQRTTRITLFAKLNTLKKRLFVSAGATYTAFKDYIYFQQGEFDDSQTVLPLQSSGQQVLVVPELRFEATFFKHFNFRSRAMYSYLPQNEDNAIQVPQLFINAQLSYENTFFGGNLQLHTGFEVHWKSDYYDYGYDPVIQQFYVQDRTITPAFFITDVFLNGKIRQGKFFIRYHNLVQAFTQVGYLATPSNYPGQRNILDFGFEILLFD